MAATTLRVARAVEARPDSDLVAATRTGDDRAFEALYDRYHPAIVRYAHGKLRDWAKAEDVTQEVFLSALRRMRETERSIAFKPWIYEIARNACIDQHRRNTRQPELPIETDGLPAAERAELADRRTAPDRVAEVGEQLDHLRGAFGGLSDSHHRLLVLRELEGRSYREIGERMGMTGPSVESAIFRARRRLGEEFKELRTGRRCTEVRAALGSVRAGDAGVRERRRVQRHLAWCSGCRRAARREGVESTELVPQGVGARAAALLPLPLVFDPDASRLKALGAALGLATATTSAGLAIYATPETPIRAPRTAVPAGSAAQASLDHARGAAATQDTLEAVAARHRREARRAAAQRSRRHAARASSSTGATPAVVRSATSEHSAAGTASVPAAAPKPATPTLSGATTGAAKAVTKVAGEATASLPEVSAPAVKPAVDTASGLSGALLPHR